jgi:hypothetical protein
VCSSYIAEAHDAFMRRWLNLNVHGMRTCLNPLYKHTVAMVTNSGHFWDDIAIYCSCCTVPDLEELVGADFCDKCKIPLKHVHQTICIHLDLV